jgi:hypothetical protein
MLILVGILVGAVVLGMLVNRYASRMPSRGRDSIERFHCNSGIPGEFRSRVDKD